jgi:hypothetical protein
MSARPDTICSEEFLLLLLQGEILGGMMNLYEDKEVG